MSRRRGYRELQADAERGMVTCPHCHSTFSPLDSGGDPSVPRAALPKGFPALSTSQLAARIAEHEPATARLHEELRERVAESTFALWLAPLRLVGADGDTLYALAPAEIDDWVRDRFGRLLEAAASTLAARPVKVIVGGTA